MFPRSMEVEKLSSAMGETDEFDDALPEDLFVSPVVVHHLMASPAFQKIPGMLAAAADLIVEDHNPRP